MLGNTALVPSGPIQLGRQQRRHPRHRVHLEVRYGSAEDYVVEYAENLSRGGLFVRGVFDVEPLEVMTLEVELPGYCRFEVKGRVCHVRRPADAVEMGANPGVGLELIETPDGFEAALHVYLERLGHRRDFAVLATNPEIRAVLTAAGYHVLAAPAPEQVGEVIATLREQVLALAIGRRERDRYAAAGPLPCDIIEIDFLAEIDEILTILDSKLVEAVR